MVTQRLEVLAKARQLHEDLFHIVQRDPEQEVLGLAIPAVDAVIVAARKQLGEEMTSDAGLVELLSPEALQAGVPVRAVDVLIVVGQVLAALGDLPTWPLRRVSEPDYGRAITQPLT